MELEVQQIIKYSIQNKITIGIMSIIIITITIVINI